MANIDLGRVELGSNEYETGVITFGGADTLAAGTILARSTASGKFIIFAKGGSTDGNGVPVAVLPNEVVATGAGDVYARPVISGKVDFGKLIIDADGDNSNVDGAVKDDLRNVSIVPVTTTQMSNYDN